jgi:phenylalanyl-tRNA synthetase alpha chain
LGERGRLRLSESEYRVVEKAAASGFRRGYVEEASRKLGISESALHSIFRLLESRGLARVRILEEPRLRLTGKGREALERGLPEEKLLGILRSRGEVSVEEARRRLGEEAGIAIGLLKRMGLVEVAGGLVRLVDPAKAEEAVSRTREALERISRGEEVGAQEARALKSRGLVGEERVRRHLVEFTVDPGSILERAVIEVGKLTGEMIREGKWRSVTLRRYDVRAEPPKILPARKHFLAEFIDLPEAKLLHYVP